MKSNPCFNDALTSPLPTIVAFYDHIHPFNIHISSGGEIILRYACRPAAESQLNTDEPVSLKGQTNRELTEKGKP
jgi:hypothetical protein